MVITYTNTLHTLKWVLEWYILIQYFSVQLLKVAMLYAIRFGVNYLHAMWLKPKLIWLTTGVTIKSCNYSLVSFYT